MADDTAAALQQLGIEKADFFGYSIVAGVALQVAIRHPDLVRKLVLTSVTYNYDGLHPELCEAQTFQKGLRLVSSRLILCRACLASRC